MYLKSLEMTGFKSFATKTSLEFEPGMTAIVGPNGCGKSNISDAVRWVLGEQSAKALRGTKMEDCIFSGTDDRKPLGMAEVSITLTDCEGTLNTEYNEMTVARRVFRSGEGQYFINKTPCRLKDIERLFMDTGIGTTSYSLMEQGRIDRILSSRPEDRRAIFEEASGITKFKTDRKEAIRKLEHTESNLLRLADVIREVKRQIGSLQRQAGKARRYKALKEDLRKVDIYTTKQHLKTADSDIHNIESEIEALNRKLSDAQREVQELERGNTALRESLMQTEREKGAVLEAAVHAQSKLDHAHELIRVNRQRIKEYQNFSERDSREIDESRKQLDDKRRLLDELAGHTEKAGSERDSAEQELKVCSDNFKKHRQQMDTARSQIQRLREELVELESLNSRLQNQLLEIESGERSTVIRRERLSAEKAQLARVASTYEKRQTEMNQFLENMSNEATHCEDALRKLEDQKSQKTRKTLELQQRRSELQSQSAARKAQINLLCDKDMTNGSIMKCSRNVMPLIRRLSIPSPVPSDSADITRNGSLGRGDACLEFWMADGHADTPLSREQVLADAKTDLPAIEKHVEEHETAIKNLLTETETLENSIDDARVKLDESKRSFARKEGENQIVSKEATDARERLETVAWELNNLNTEGESGDTEKKAIIQKRDEISGQREKITSGIDVENKNLQQLENRHSELQSEVTERRIRSSELSQKVERLESQKEDVKTRVEELGTMVKDRSAGIISCEAGIDKLTEAIKSAENQLSSLEEQVKADNAKAESLRKNGEKQSKELEEMENALSRKRTSLEELRNAKSELDIRITESRMRRQNQIDRITSEYGIALEQVMKEPDPEWKDEKPSLETIETRVAELRTKIEAMGPVNLVAIEEYNELEERHAFLTGQQADLIKAKQQLMDMIRKIDRTTSEMFRTTFEQVNTNFLTVFKKLFNGGSARLVLVNEEDVLECGIEIIARPPGKRLQNVSLLSGGERTLTAVALLFAIYMIKPSPFCLLDEIDAALDDSNIGRFVNLLQDFLKQSQFVVITHNRQTIAAADILYGVTMHEKGISNIVSMKFTDYKEETTDSQVGA